MERKLQFLAGRISEEVIASKLRLIEDAFKSKDCFDGVPNEPGIYIMVSRKRDLVYPKKDSPVFYIGTSKHLKERLKTHLRRYKEAEKDFKNHCSWQYCRYNYAVAFGVDVYYMRITGREHEKALERKALEGFYDKYGAIPVGNGAFSFSE